MFIAGLGVTFFGLIIGLFTYWIRLSRAGAPALSDLTAIAGIVGSAAVVAILRDGGLFGWYCIGLALGLLVSFALAMFGKPAGLSWRIPSTPPTDPSLPG